MPEVSVIVPNYNHAPFLLERIRTVCAQTYTSFEIILLDDHSTDNSKEILNDLVANDKVSHVVFNDQNVGAFQQWRNGILLAKGKYIWIAESDDLAAPEFLKELMTAFEDEEVILSYCRSRVINVAGKDLGNHCWMDKLNSVRWKSDYKANAATEVEKYLKFRNTICNASSVVFRNTPDLEKMIPVDMEFCGDWLFWKRYLQQPGKIAYSHKPLNYFRDHADSTRSVKSAHREGTRCSEYKQFITPTRLLFFEYRYDWMFWEWMERRHILPPVAHDLHWDLYVRYLLVGASWHCFNTLRQVNRAVRQTGLSQIGLKLRSRRLKANTGNR